MVQTKTPLSWKDHPSTSDVNWDYSEQDEMWVSSVRGWGVSPKMHMMNVPEFGYKIFKELINLKTSC